MASHTPSGSGGFTYLGLMLLISIAGILMSAAGMMWQQEIQRQKEIELLFRGAQYKQAIKSYFDSTPTGVKQYPRKLEDLLKDNRFPKVKRHIRTLYSNPINEKEPWRLIKEQDQIIGVYVESNKKPLTRVFKSKQYEGFNNADSYTKWQFVFRGAQAIEQDNEQAIAHPPAKEGSTENIAKPTKPISQEDECDKVSNADYMICREVCQDKSYDVCKLCYQSLRDRKYACMHQQQMLPLVTSK